MLDIVCFLLMKLYLVCFKIIVIPFPLIVIVEANLSQKIEESSLHENFQHYDFDV